MATTRSQSLFPAPKKQHENTAIHFAISTVKCGRVCVKQEPEVGFKKKKQTPSLLGSITAREPLYGGTNTNTGRQASLWP